MIQHDEEPPVVFEVDPNEVEGDHHNVLISIMESGGLPARQVSIPYDELDRAVRAVQRLRPMFGAAPDPSGKSAVLTESFHAHGHHHHGDPAVFGVFIQEPESPEEFRRFHIEGIDLTKLADVLGWAPGDELVATHQHLWICQMQVRGDAEIPTLRLYKWSWATKKWEASV
jgi:hypothetical protein